MHAIYKVKNCLNQAMLSFTHAFVIVLTGILFWRWCLSHVVHNKLPPGPMPLPIIGSLHLLGKLPHRALHKLSQKYGPIMSIRLGSVQFVIVSSPDAAKHFLGTQDAVFASRPDVQASKYMSYGRKGLTFAEYGPYWRGVRKFCTLELLSATKISGFAGMRREEIGLMLEELRGVARVHKVVNLNDIVGGLIEGMTCRMLFGKKNDEMFVFKRLIDESMEAAGLFNLADYVPILAPFDLQGLTKRFKSLSKEIDEVIETLINEHEEEGSPNSPQSPHHQKDFIDILLSLKHQNSKTHDELSYSIDRSSMKAILLDIVAGAIDTAKTSIEWIMSVLIRHPRVMKELQKELKAVVGDKPMVEETDLTKLQYLHMVIKETFRLYPVAPLMVPHESMEDTVIDGYEIPKKTRVLVNVWAFGRDPNVWSENWEEFLPERFLDREIDFRGPDQFRLIHFGTGRRGCPGMNLGLLNIGLVVSNMVHYFNWELPNNMSPSDLDMQEKFGLTTPREKSLLAIPTYRI